MKRGINCGSGQRPFTATPEVEWYNVDSQAKWEPDIICDGAHLPFADEAVDYFVLSHTAEHFGCGGASGLIQEAARVLKDGGSLIVSVPDMRALAKGWLDGKISTQIYFTNVYGAYMGDEADRHKWGFDNDSLREFLLASVNWKVVMPFDWRPIPGMDLARDWWILGAEAIK